MRKVEKLLEGMKRREGFVKRNDDASPESGAGQKIEAAGDSREWVSGQKSEVRDHP